MPELPDITVYLEAIEQRVLGRRLDRVQVINIFVLRTAIPPIDSLVGRRVIALRRLGKRIALAFEGGPWLVVHLMIAGRLHWAEGTTKPTARNALLHCKFENGTLTLTEAGTKRRASVHVVEGETGVKAIDPGGLDVLSGSREEFAA